MQASSLLLSISFPRPLSNVSLAKKGEGEEKEGMCDIYREADI